MFCGQCGKENPDGARFCAFCGAKYEGKSPSPPGEQRGGQTEQPAHEAYMRPDPSRQVRPNDGNPAQPRRTRREAAEGARDEAATARPAARTSPRPEVRSAPKPVWKAESAKDDAPARAKANVPPRKPPIAPRKNAAWERVNTLIPRRRPRDNDLFFDDRDLPDENPRYEDGAGLARKIKSAVGAVSLLIILGVIFWVLVLPGGAQFRASVGMNAPASAYFQLGEQYLAENSVKRAADTFYHALALDPNNYDYALRVGQTQQLVGDRDKAMSAYAKCITLKPDQPEPYQAVAALFEQMGEKDRARDAYKAGYDNTGNIDLFRAYEALAPAEPEVETVAPPPAV